MTIISTFLCAFISSHIWAATPEAKAPVVLVRTAQPTELFDVLTYPARVLPKVQADVLAESEGVVAAIKAPLGKKVRRGQKLMVIQHTDPVYQYAPMHVRAPVAGSISRVEVSEGTLVSRGQRLATITDPSKIRVVVEAAAADLPLLKAGQSGEMRLPGKPPVQVTIRGISPAIDPVTGTATCELDPSASLPPGLIGQVQFKVNVREGLSIPEHAVVYREGKTFVRLVEEGKAKYREVSLGRKQRGQVEILNGMPNGASLIERASQFVADGEAVTLQETQKTNEATL